MRRLLSYIAFLLASLQQPIDPCMKLYVARSLKDFTALNYAGVTKLIVRRLVESQAKISLQVTRQVSLPFSCRLRCLYAYPLQFATAYRRLRFFTFEDPISTEIFPDFILLSMGQRELPTVTSHTEKGLRELRPRLEARLLIFPNTATRHYSCVLFICSCGPVASFVVSLARK